MRLRAQTDYETALALLGTGMGASAVARRTGIPRGTIRGWQEGRGAYHRRLAEANSHWRPRNPGAYVYLLGIYLGDGCITVTRSGAASLVVSMDSTYPGIITEVQATAGVVFPSSPIRAFLSANESTTVIRVSHPALPFAFPQHGAGRKHQRQIALTAWQAELTATHPRQLLRGLIHSDGCRTVNRFRTRLPSGRVAEYEYPRYFFSNLSPDIRGIFCAHCDLLGIRWTQSNPRNISVSHRDSVAMLDAFVGHKV
jgi:hypothetical protein